MRKTVYTKICIWRTSGIEPIGEMVRRKNMKNAINILAIIFAWGALILSIFAFGDMTGNILKAVTYGLIVGNAVLVNFICVHNLKENKE